jgi:hypothetical protein
MLQRLNVRDNEKPEAARKRFDGQLAVHAWATPGRPMAEPGQERTPWWWNKAEADQSTQVFMEMARARGMVE